MKLVAAVLALAIGAPPTVAAPICGQSDKIAATLSGKYGETITGAGMSNDGSHIFVMSNPVTGTFTVVLRGKNNISCLILAGKGYQSVTQDKPADGEEM